MPVLNGLLNLTSLELKAFDQNLIFTYKFNVRFNAEAKCSRWLGFLDQILPVEDHPLLQECLGYCILPAMPKHKVMWFYGLGRNGKGRVIATLEAIIGLENCSYFQLEEFDGEHRFAVAGLYGKMINVNSELSTVAVLQTPLLKKIPGEDTLDAEVKGKQKRLSFRNVAKPFVLGNEFPRVSDTSLAFEDRTLILKSPNSFVGKNQVDNIERTWLEDSLEVSGIFNWMLEDLHRLSLNGDFTLSRTTQEVILDFKRISDPIGAWMEDNCVFDVAGFVSRKAAFEDYKNYCDQELGKAPETERFKGIQLKNSLEHDKIDCEGQTQLASTPSTTTTTDKLNCQKIIISDKENNLCVKKPVVSVVAEVANKKDENKETLEVGAQSKTALLNNEPIHYHILAPNEPHPCDSYGCSREAKYNLGTSYYCDDKAVSHFKEIANKCHQEGFTLIEDWIQLDV